MGIHGLSKFIQEHSDTFLTPLELRDTCLVIDGNCVAIYLYRNYMESYCAFGGDYDVYQQVVKDFFAILSRCNITPIVIMDGGHEERKIKTINQRRFQTFNSVKTFQHQFSTAIILPLFLIQVFCDVLQELGIINIRCYLEADSEIASVARYLNCPLLSNDSDFFLMNVKYIPFPNLDLEPLEPHDETLGGPYLNCSFFNISTLLNEFEGLRMTELPVVAALLGNDYVDSSVFSKFYNHVILEKNKNASYNQRKILGVFNWLKSENLESAKSLIVKHLKKNHVKIALKAINDAVGYYTIHPPSKLTLSKISDLTLNTELDVIESNIELNEKLSALIAELPDDLLHLLQESKIHAFIMDILYLNCYFLTPQVEALCKKSSHYLSYPIISAIHIILNSYLSTSKVLVVNVLHKKNFVKHCLHDSVSHCFDGINIRNLRNESVMMKCNVILSILNLKKEEVTLQVFDNDWKLFMLSLIYWLIKEKNELTSVHVHALLLMSLGNFIQNRVGYFKNYSSFMSVKAGRLNRLSKEKNIAKNVDNYSFTELLDGIPEIELLSFTKKFIKLRKASEEVIQKWYSVYHIHLFATFQSCLFHIIQLNALLNCPFKSVKVGNFYSGTFLYNIFYILKSKSNVECYVLEILKEIPSIYNIYRFLLDQLVSHMPPSTNILSKNNNSNNNVRRTKKKKTIKKKKK